MIAEVAFPVHIHKTFHYKVPPDIAGSLKIGMRVEAPFGRRRSVGVVADIHENAPVALAALKDVGTVVDPFHLTPSSHVAP